MQLQNPLMHCCSPDSEKASKTKSSAKRNCPILHLLIATHSLVRLSLYILYIKIIKKRGDKTHPCQNTPLPTHPYEITLIVYHSHKHKLQANCRLNSGKHQLTQINIILLRHYPGLISKNPVLCFL